MRRDLRNTWRLAGKGETGLFCQRRGKNKGQGLKGSMLCVGGCVRLLGVRECREMMPGHPAGIRAQLSSLEGHAVRCPDFILLVGGSSFSINTPYLCSGQDSYSRVVKGMESDLLGFESWLCHLN